MTVFLEVQGRYDSKHDQLVGDDGRSLGVCLGKIVNAERAHDDRIIIGVLFQSPPYIVGYLSAHDMQFQGTRRINLTYEEAREHARQLALRAARDPEFSP